MADRETAATEVSLGSKEKVSAELMCVAVCYGSKLPRRKICRQPQVDARRCYALAGLGPDLDFKTRYPFIGEEPYYDK